ERRTPAAVDDIHLVARIAACAHCPDHVADICRIDVVIHDDGPAVVVGARVAVRSDHSRLLGMAAIQRLDRDHQHEATAAGLMSPDALHFGDAGCLELVPDRAAAVCTEIEGVVVRRYCRNRAYQYRVLAIHEGVDPDRGLQIAAAGIVT